MQGFFQSTEVQLPVPLTTVAPSGSSPLTPSSELGPSSNVQKDDEDVGTDILPLRIALISRRSTARPGLRFQRRGVDVTGNVANFVETEFVVGATTNATASSKGGQKFVASFVQTRGSIPLFWSQNATALKPPPVLERGPQENAGESNCALRGIVLLTVAVQRLCANISNGTVRHMAPRL